MLKCLATLTCWQWENHTTFDAWFSTTGTRGFHWASPRGCHGSNELNEDDIPLEPTTRRQPPPNIDLDPPQR